MGCDIHMHIEIKQGGKWHLWSQCSMNHHYELFSLLAGVRQEDDSPRPIAKPRGIPADVSEVVKRHSDYWGETGHSHSYLSAKEWVKVVKYAEKQGWASSTRRNPFDWETDEIGYVYGNAVSGFAQYPEEWKHTGIEDIRLVFWFDN